MIDVAQVVVTLLEKIYNEQMPTETPTHSQMLPQRQHANGASMTACAEEWKIWDHLEIVLRITQTIQEPREYLRFLRVGRQWACPICVTSGSNMPPTAAMISLGLRDSFCPLAGRPEGSPRYPFPCISSCAML